MTYRGVVVSFWREPIVLWFVVHIPKEAANGKGYECKVIPPFRTVKHYYWSIITVQHASASSIMHVHVYPASLWLSYTHVYYILLHYAHSLKSTACVHYDNPFWVLLYSPLIVAVSMPLWFKELTEQYYSGYPCSYNSSSLTLTVISFPSSS